MGQKQGPSNPVLSKFRVQQRGRHGGQKLQYDMVKYGKVVSERERQT